VEDSKLFLNKKAIFHNAQGLFLGPWTAVQAFGIQ
jgi:hypothetical protein